mgnify:CR=1 FL=1
MGKKLIVLIFLIIAAVITYNYIYQDHRNIENETAEFVMTSDEVTQLFSENSSASEQLLLNKTIEVSGLISDINNTEITIENTVFCQFTNQIKTTALKGSKIKIKGRFIGYDDLLEQVKIDQSILITNK